MTRATTTMMMGLALASVASMGCAPPAQPRFTPVMDDVPAKGPNGWATATLFLDERLEWPYELSGISVAVDGEVVFEGDATTENDRLAVLELEPGEHTIRWVTRARYASTPFDDDRSCEVAVRADHTVTMGKRQSSVVLGVFQRGVTAPFEERLALSVVAKGTARDGRTSVRAGRIDVGDAAMCTGGSPLVGDPKPLEKIDPVWPR